MGIVSDDVLSLVKRELEDSAEKIVRISDLSRKYNVSRKDLHYCYLRKYGISIMDYHSRLKFILFNITLREKNGSLYKTSFDVALSVGFKSDSSLQYFIRKMTGISFGDYLDWFKDYFKDK